MKEIAINRKANFEYFIEDTYECGIVLSGSEVKSLRQGHLNIAESYAVIKNGEAWLLNANIPCYEKTSSFKSDEKRTRKLLLHKNQILKLEKKVQDKSYTLVPLKAYFKEGYVKILIAVAKGKHLYDKKQSLKEKAINRDTLREIKTTK